MMGLAKMKQTIQMEVNSLGMRKFVAQCGKVMFVKHLIMTP